MSKMDWAPLISIFWNASDNLVKLQISIASAFVYEKLFMKI